VNPYDPLIIRALHSKWNRRLRIATLVGVLVVAIDVIRQLGA
jgi:hypothetical protein